MVFFDLSNQQLIDAAISLGILAATAVLGKPVLNFLLDRVLGRITRNTKTSLDDNIVKAVRPPLFWIILTAAAEAAVNRLDYISQISTWDFPAVFFTLYLLFAFTVSWRLVVVFADWYGKEVAPHTDSDIDNQLIPFMRRIALILVSIFALIVLFDYFNIEISGLVTTLGIGSLAVALAAQAALSDTISGFMIMIDRPFRIGDRIELQALNTWGDVVDIGLRSTRIRTLDNRMVIVPNSVIAKSLIVNHTFPDTQYRIQIEIGVAYGSDIELVRSILVEAVKTVPGVINSQSGRPVEALFLEFGAYALVFRVRWWIESYVDTRRMFDKVNTVLYAALKQAGIEIPFPQQHVYIRVADRDDDNISNLLGKNK